MSLLPLALLALAVPLHAGDCVFDGDCAPRPGVVAIHDAAPDSEAVESGLGAWEGAQAGAREGAKFGALAAMWPAVALMDEGFSRRLNGEASSGKLLYGAGVALGTVLILPSLVAGAAGSLIGAIAGTLAPDAARDWDAEKTLL